MDETPKPPSRIQRRRIDSAATIADSPAEQIAYQHTVFCQTCLPYRDPGDDVREWERRQGDITLQVAAGALRDPQTQRFVKVGLPFGAQPRLIIAHLNREALLHQSPRIDVEATLMGFIRRVLKRRPDGRHYARFKDQLSRLSGALVRMAADISETHALQIDTKIVDVFDLWRAKDEGQRVPWSGVVELSPRYFESLAKHAVPLDERAVCALQNSPMALDVYCWLAQRLRRVPEDKPQRITWKAMYDQFGQGYHLLRQFRAAFLDVLDVVHGQYRAARIEADDQGLVLRHSRPPVGGRIAVVHKRLA